jgi:exonuclease VII small subunit
MAAYERAVGLIKRCRNDLSKAEQRVIELSKAMSDSAQDSSRSSD